MVNFFLFRVINPHPERTLARGRAKTPEQVQAVIEKYGLDEPLPQQFLIYLKNIVTLDFGDSYQYCQPVRGLMLDRLWPTLVLVGTSTILSIIFGLWIGTIAAWNRGHKFDQHLDHRDDHALLDAGVVARPDPVLRLLHRPRGRSRGCSRSAGCISTGVDPSSLDGVIDQAWHLVLPVITLTLAYLAEYSLIMRSALLDEMGEDYLQTARAKGLRDVLVRRRHATRNALLPGGHAGLAQHRVHRRRRDHDRDGVLHPRARAADVPTRCGSPTCPMLQGTFFVFSAAVVVANLISNLLYGCLDPRVRI